MKLRSFLLFLFLGILLLNCRQSESKLVPESIAGFKLVKTLEGEQAKSYINRLHFKNVAPQENTIAFYKKDNKELILYLTLYEQDDEARKDWQRMVKKISPENSVFVQGTVLNLDGKDVYRCFGMGQTHFVFVHQNALIWFSVPTIGSMEIFEAYNKTLN